MCLRGTAAQKCALEMYVDDGIPILIRHLKDQIITQNTRVIDQNIQLTKVAGRLVYRVLHHGSVRDITLYRQSLRPQALDLSGYTFAAFNIDIRERDSCAFFCQTQSGGGSNASTGSCDECNTSF